MKPALTAPTEHTEQCALVRWFDTRYPRHSSLLFAIPNGGYRNKVTASMLRAEGVRAGVPDLMLAIPAPPWHGLFVEMKRRGSLGRVTEAQRLMHNRLSDMGYCVRVCKGWDEAREAIEAYATAACAYAKRAH